MKMNATVKAITAIAAAALLSMSSIALTGCDEIRNQNLDEASEKYHENHIGWLPHEIMPHSEQLDNAQNQIDNAIDKANDIYNEGKEAAQNIIPTAKDKAQNAANTAKEKTDEFIDHRKNSVPGYYALNEFATVNDKLSVTVVSAEEGPFDYLDKTETTKVTVKYKNTSDSPIVVEASNFNADTKNGLRVDHKYRIFDESGKAVAKSFSVATVSPNSTTTQVLYFDGKLRDVCYQPIHLVSAENELLFWEVS